MADYQSYLDCQHTVADAYSHTDSWTRMAILNAIRMGMFSSDRSVRDYCDGIWKASPLPITLAEYNADDFSLGNELTCRIR
jgi:starch phosphorylase